MKLIEQTPTPLAVHEAAHAIVAGVCDLQTCAVDLTPRWNGTRARVSIATPLNPTVADHRRALIIYAAGTAAERELTGDEEVPLSGTDLNQSLTIIKQLHGMIRAQSAQRGELREAMRTARRIVRRRWPDVLRFARAIDHCRTEAFALHILHDRFPRVPGPGHWQRQHAASEQENG